jgi:hypothetical protein
VLVNGPNDFVNAFATMTQAEAQAVIIQGLFDPHRAIIIELATKHRLPIMAPSRETVAAGGLISYVAKYSALYERAASESCQSRRASGRATDDIRDGCKCQDGEHARLNGSSRFARSSRRRDRLRSALSRQR